MFYGNQISVPVAQFVRLVIYETIDQIQSRLGNPSCIKSDEARALVAKILRNCRFRGEQQLRTDREQKTKFPEMFQHGFALRCTKHSGPGHTSRYLSVP